MIKFTTVSAILFYSAFAILFPAEAPLRWTQAPNSQEKPASAGPQSGSVSANRTLVKAGESITFHIDLDKPTDVPRTYMSVGVGGPGPVGASNSVALQPGKTGYDVEIVIPPDAPGGTWQLQEVVVGTVTGMHHNKIKFGETVTFQVLQESTFELPTAAKISISPSQTQLLRGEAEVLRNNVEALKGAILALPAGPRDHGAATILRENVLIAERNLLKTETDFLQLMSGQSQRPAAKVFFGDLQFSYQRVLTEINTSLGSPLDETPHLREVRQKTQSGASAEAVFRAFELNQLAYNTVADTGSLTFNLKVNSFPPGAVVSYGRRGDSSFEHLQDPTNSEIQALPYAIWIVRFEEPGFDSEQREHNPFTDKNHVMTVELRAEKTKRAK